MQKIQLMCINGGQNNAGEKAPSDVMDFAEELGYKKVVFRMRNTDSFIKKLLSYLILIYDFISFRIKYCTEECILFLQYPFHISENVLFLFLKMLNRVVVKHDIKVITLLHDVNEMRNKQSKKKLLEKIMNLSTCLIAHNNKMIEYLIDRGISPDKLVNLEIFDYKIKDSNENKIFIFDRKVIIAGNLDSNKVGYIRQLHKINNITFELYGPNFQNDSYITQNIKYKGIVAPSDLPSKLTSGFGLVWDGDSIDTCSGLCGNYLRYNNPHKTSLYLASGLPVIVWKEAAIAEFIKKYNLGFIVESLDQINNVLANLTESEYFEYTDSIKLMSKKLNDGYFTKKAILACENVIDNKTKF